RNPKGLRFDWHVVSDTTSLDLIRSCTLQLFSNSPMKNKFQKVPKARRNVTIIFREEGCSENRDEQEWSSRPVPHLPAFFIKVRPRELAERKIFSYQKRTK